ncbi:MAG TPA: SMC-Scp complex subunit ScpB [Thermoplasmata archaeon]|nr:SMC-Scp complex subunit ScpB [Thermoplasmata archaeon]
MPSRIDDLVFQVEAVLFASGKPLSVKELTAALGRDDYRPVQRAVRTLERTYGHRQSALEVRRVGDRYALQLVEKYVPTVQSVTPVEMAPRTLKALTLIAYHQPILQSHLVRMIGDVAYEEVQHLRGLGLVHTEPKGTTLELSTTRRFAEYFGIASTQVEEIRRFLEQKLGVPSPPGGAPAPSPEAGPEAPAGPVEPVTQTVPPPGEGPTVDSVPAPVPVEDDPAPE